MHKGRSILQDLPIRSSLPSIRQSVNILLLFTARAEVKEGNFENHGMLCICYILAEWLEKS